MLSPIRQLAALLVFPFAGLCSAEPPLPSRAPLEPIVKRGDFVAMAGDSITYMSRYSLWVEMYLLAARPDLDLRVMKVQRWCGGTADNYAAETLEQELIPAKPNVFTVCFGMNDGGGQPLTSETAVRYENSLTQILERNRANGTVTVLCSPGVVDEFSYENLPLEATALGSGPLAASDLDHFGQNPAATVYNRTLAGLRDVARHLAETQKMPFADVHDAMWQLMRSAVADYGASRPPRISLRRPDRGVLLCDDGIHPDTAAHIPMAYAVLKALRFDGAIGSITLDWAHDAVECDPAQTATLNRKGVIEVESSRLPLCFFDDSACSEGYPSVPCRYVLRKCPFNEELNRYVLKVRGLPNKRVRVTWGQGELFFTREQLEAGINLAAEFPENPFCAEMRALDAAVWKKQVYERTLFEILNVSVWNQHFSGMKPDERREALQKNFTGVSAWLAREFPQNKELKDACEAIRVRALGGEESIAPSELAEIRRILFQREQEYQLQARGLVAPLRHVIKIEPAS